MKNDIFSRAGETIAQMESVESTEWKEFVDRFEFSKKESKEAITSNLLDRQSRFQNPDFVFEKYLFPYALVALNPKTKNSEMFQDLSAHWRREHKEASSSDLISQLSQYQDDYMDIAFGTNRRQLEEFSKAINRLIRLQYPASVYPFVIKISNEIYQNQALKKKPALL